MQQELVKLLSILSKDKESYFFGVALVAAPFFIINAPTIDVRHAKDFFFIAICLLSLVLFGVKKRKDLWPLVLLLGYSLLLRNKVPNYFTFFQTIIFSLGCILAYQLSSIKLNLKVIKCSLIVVSFIMSIWMILEYYGLDIQAFLFQLMGNKGVQRVWIQNGVLVPKPITVKGALGNETISAVLTASCLPLFFSRRLLFLSVFPIIATYLSNSAMSVGTALASSTLYIFLRFKRERIYLIPVIVSGFFIAIYKFPRFFSDTGRFQAWNKIIDLAGFDPIGKGWGWFHASSKITQDGVVFKQAHCEILDLYISVGLIGIALVLTCLSKIRIKDKAIFCIFCGLLINSLANLTFHIGPLSLIAIVCYSILTGEYDERR